MSADFQVKYFSHAGANYYFFLFYLPLKTIGPHPCPPVNFILKIHIAK